ncbi:MAG TPA: SUMF1/EgtB/PvdO family nonheme iron enzyme [Clostridiales bacterium]|nr:SUMF1/EgtB/PvdO family nonheme iron enzyme [Clostridiales bacterium]
MLSTKIRMGTGSNRVKRGGNWNNNANNCRVANRNNNNPNNSNNNIGFRLSSTGAHISLYTATAL